MRTSRHGFGPGAFRALPVAGLLVLLHSLAAEEPIMKNPERVPLVPAVRLPDGNEFTTWAPRPPVEATYFVDGTAAHASDANPGTRERPFRTIGRAAERLQPGECVEIAGGHYRERVVPARGGTSPDRMISYRAAPGARVVVSGSEIVQAPFTPSPEPGVWRVRLEPDLFAADYNPFRIPNITPEQFDGMVWAHPLRGKAPYTRPRGLVFQDGKRLLQVGNEQEVRAAEGTWCVDAADGVPVLTLRPFDGADPNTATVEVTVRETVFAPMDIGLGYIHVRGLTLEHAGNAFPMPQTGALSTGRGHHWLIEGNTVRQANGIGIDIGTQYWALPQPPIPPGAHIVRQNRVTDCGVCGIQGLGCRNSLIENNLLERNAFHPVEPYFETGGIKTHGNVDTLIRRNRILDTPNGAGIWMDFANINSRCTENVIVASATMHGAIFIEASQYPNMIDRNIILDTRGHGIYEHDCSGQIIAHNLIVGSDRAAIRLRGKVTDRLVHGKPIESGNHTVVNNLFVRTAGEMDSAHRQADLSGNATATEGIAFDRERFAIERNRLPQPEAGKPVPGIGTDFLGVAYGDPPGAGAFAEPGPPVPLADPAGP